jgi:hypothetical protein
MRMRQPIEESLVMLIEELKEEIEVYDSFFRLNVMKPEEESRWKEMLEEHRYMKDLYQIMMKQLERLDQI